LNQKKHFESEMKAYELLNSPDAWCQGSAAEAAQGRRVPALDSRAVKWCVLGAIQKVYPSRQWEEAMDTPCGRSASLRGASR
jgi:hypothetical protein